MASAILSVEKLKEVDMIFGSVRCLYNRIKIIVWAQGVGFESASHLSVPPILNLQL